MRYTPPPQKDAPAAVQRLNWYAENNLDSVSPHNSEEAELQSANQEEGDNPEMHDTNPPGLVSYGAGTWIA